MAEPTEPTSEIPAVEEPTVEAPAEPVEPASAEAPELIEPEAVGADAPAPLEPEPVVAEPVVAEPVAVAAEVPAEVAAPHSAREVVYVQAPTPPVPRQNRGFGVLIALLGAVAFAVLYIAAAAIIVAFTPGAEVGSILGQFVAKDVFWVPVVVYAVFAVVFALIVNRAAWWAHVIGSLFVAALSYVVSVGVLALMRNVITLTPDEAVTLFGEIAGSVFLLVALALAREASLWFGLAIAARGRKIKERNATDRALFEQSVADRRAEYERAHPSA